MASKKKKRRTKNRLGLNNGDKQRCESIMVYMSRILRIYGIRPEIHTAKRFRQYADLRGIDISSDPIRSILNLVKEGKLSELSMDNRFCSRERWKRLRSKVLEHYGSQCMCCPSTERIQVDHIFCRLHFPELSYCWDNLQVLCEKCNSRKRDGAAVDYRGKKARVLSISNFEAFIPAGTPITAWKQGREFVSTVSKADTTVRLPSLIEEEQVVSTKGKWSMKADMGRIKLRNAVAKRKKVPIAKLKNIRPAAEGSAGLTEFMKSKS